VTTGVLVQMVTVSARHKAFLGKEQNCLTMRYLIAAILFALALGARANEITGKELLALCEAPRDTPLNALCEGYIWVSSRGYDIAEVWSDQCRNWAEPEGVTPREIYWLVVEWMRDNPHMLNQDMDDVIVTALKDAFPCTESIVTMQLPLAH